MRTSEIDVGYDTHSMPRRPSSLYPCQRTPDASGTPQARRTCHGRRLGAGSRGRTPAGLPRHGLHTGAPLPGGRSGRTGRPLIQTAPLAVSNGQAHGAADHDSRTLRTRSESETIALRFGRRWGPHRIGYHPRLPQSTVSKVLNRYTMPLLGHVDLNTDQAVRKPNPRRDGRPITSP